MALVTLVGAAAAQPSPGRPLAWRSPGPLEEPTAAPADAATSPPGDDAPADEVDAAPPPGARPWQTDDPEVTHDPRLAAELEQALANVSGRVGLAVKDLGSGRGALLAADSELPAASLFKLPVLYSAFNAALPLSEELLITSEIKQFDLGTLELGVGETLTVGEALERMVTLSDNSSAIMLANRVTPSRLRADMLALGLISTHYQTERLTTSPMDMLHLLEQVARGRAVSASASAEMVHLLLRQRVNDRLPRLLPEGVPVAHKTGNLPGVVNDVGIIYGAHGTVIVAAQVTDTTDEAAAADGIAQVARGAYLHFEALTEVADRPVVPPQPSRPVPPVWRQPRPAPPAAPAEPRAVLPPIPTEPPLVPLPRSSTAPAIPATTSEKPAAVPATTSDRPAAAPATTSEKPAAAPATTSEKPAAVPATTSEKPAAVPAATSDRPAAAPAATSEKPAAVARTPSSEIPAAQPTPGAARRAAPAATAEPTAAPTRPPAPEPTRPPTPVTPPPGPTTAPTAAARSAPPLLTPSPPPR